MEPRDEWVPEVVEALEELSVARRAAAATVSASAALLADGFSVKTCLPAPSVARFHGPWRLLASGL